MALKNKLLIVGALVGLVLIITGAIVGFKVLEDYVKDEIAASTRLENGTEQYDRWEDLPFPLSFSVYFFKVKNKDEVLNNGAKPEVEEIGPYVWDEDVNKEEIVYNDETGIFTYEQRKVFNFNTQKTPPDVLAQETVMMMSAPMMGVAQTLEDTGMLGWIEESYLEIFKSSDDHVPSIFEEFNVQDVAFNGYRFCNPKYTVSPNAIIICSALRMLNKRSMPTDPETREIKFTFFASKHDTTDGVWEVNSGNFDVNKLGSLLTWNGEKYTSSLWEPVESVCNLIRGGDSVLYRPYSDRDTVHTVYSSDICRAVELEYSRDVEFKDINGYRSVIKKNTMDMDREENKCFCIKKTANLAGEKECLPSGFMDMYHCQDAPLILSFPHFLWADREYADTVTGLSPNEDDHAIFVSLEPGTGSPLQGKKRVQFNMVLRQMKDFPITNNIRSEGAMMPLLWIEEGSEITDELATKLQDDYLSKLVLVDAVRWTLIAVGIALFMGCGTFYVVGQTKMRTRT